ncbi:hypothetical protein EON83_08525 [bacterium]|nr:MAG: hypothetical protein EON83_08525 [bacterium]
MFQFNKSAHLLVASALCAAALMLPVAAQAHGKRNDATKVVDATVLPARKVLHGAKKVGESAVRRVGHMGKQIF